MGKSTHEVSKDLMNEALYILNKTKREFGSSKEFSKITLGAKTLFSEREALNWLDDYLIKNRLEGKIDIQIEHDLQMGGRIREHGAMANPDKRKLTLYIGSNFKGLYHANGIESFANHEIGTHAIRALNDRLQPWATNRERFGLAQLGGRISMSTEEGLASLHTILGYPDDAQYLWSAALLYYCAARGSELNFKELFHDLEQYIESPTLRYWHCVRCKRGVFDQNEPGSSGKNQAYLEGAVKILRNIDNIDFTLLYSGKIPIEKLSRVKLVARTAGIKLPSFLINNLDDYRWKLKRIGRLNGILNRHFKISRSPEIVNLNASLELIPQKKTKSIFGDDNDRSENNDNNKIEFDKKDDQHLFPSYSRMRPSTVISPNSINRRRTSTITIGKFILKTPA